MSAVVAREQVQRLIFRCISEAINGAIARLSRRFDGDFIKGLVFLSLSRDGVVRDGADRGLSIRGIANSFDLPSETIRRRVQDLLTSGLVRRTPGGGFAPSEEGLKRVYTPEWCEETVAALNVVLGKLAALDYGPGEISLPAEGDRTESLEKVVQAFDTFALRASRCGPVLHGDLVNTVIFIALLYFNAAPVAYDPDLAWRYAGRDEPPPDHLLMPISAAVVARSLALAPLTVRRRLSAMATLGRCEKVKCGYVASRAFIETPEALNSGLLVSQYFEQMLNELERS